jgi:hypothetical protein
VLSASEQWIARPSRSVALTAEERLASGEVEPNTSVTSEVVFSSSMSAVPIPAKSQPAWVNGTHGAGVFSPPVVISVGVSSAVEEVGSVQYLNAELKPEPCVSEGSEKGYSLATVIPLRSG